MTKSHYRLNFMINIQTLQTLRGTTLIKTSWTKPPTLFKKLTPITTPA